jgi:hypothetical protein
MTAISPLLTRPEPSSAARTSSARRSAVPAPRCTSAPSRLRAVDGGRSVVARRQRRVYRQRRVVVVVLLVASVALGGRLAASAVELFASADVAAPTVTDVAPVPMAAVTDAGSVTYVVRSGDTLWSIARQVRPAADPRAVVDELAVRVPGGALQPGQQLDLSDLDG